MVGSECREVEGLGGWEWYDGEMRVWQRPRLEKSSK